MRISDWSSDVCSSDLAVSSIHDSIYNGLALYLERETPEFYAAELGEAARCADKDPQTAIEMLAEKRNLREMDGLSETMLAEALWQLPREGRRSMLLAYLGFPFYDIAILPIRSEEHTSELQSLMRISYAVFCLK